MRAPVSTKSALFRVGNSQTVDQRRRCYKTIFDRHGLAGCAKTSQQLRPSQSSVRSPIQTRQTPDARVEPAFQGGALPSLGKDEDPELHQVFDNPSVDSDSTARKKFFCGQASSQSITPSLRGASRPTKR